MTTDGGGWTLTFKWRSANSDVTSYFNQFAISTDTAIGAPNLPPSGSLEGLSMANRVLVWAAGATEYRMASYGAAADSIIDLKKNTNLDTMNVSFCAASGCGNSPSGGYSNATFGTATVLSTGPYASANAVVTLLQWGLWNCNCNESIWIDSYNNGKKVFGDGISSNVVYTNFWIR